jgi:hypothetical protein
VALQLVASSRAVSSTLNTPSEAKLWYTVSSVVLSCGLPSSKNHTHVLTWALAGSSAEAISIVLLSKTYRIGRKIYAQLGRDKNLFCKRIGTSPLIGGNQGDRISGFHIREDIDRLCQIGFKVVDVPEPLR